MRMTEADIIKYIGIEKIIEKHPAPPSMISFKSSNSISMHGMIEAVALDIGFESLGSIEEYEDSARHFNKFDIELDDWIISQNDDTTVIGTKVFEGLNLIAWHWKESNQDMIVYGFEVVSGSGNKEDDYYNIVLGLRFEVETDKLNGKVKMIAGSLSIEGASYKEIFVLKVWSKDFLNGIVTFSCQNPITKKIHDFRVVPKGGNTNELQSRMFV